jgi:alkanesulfonate monooxygenase SsuD/methylene tetrahydromethanopterin reductase-like flavin-dependent oxidoreductase (luciferase family)
MQYGLALPTGGECGDPRFLADLAALAEEAGWDGVFLEDYICFQGDPVAPTCDPWVALSAIAVRTTRVRVGTLVTPLSRRRPWKLAREVLGIDQLSGGRMILGVGLGDTGEHVVGDASFSAFDEVGDPKMRAEMLDEALAVLAGLLSGRPFSFAGRHYSVSEVAFRPSSVQQPRVPIWVGGGYPLTGPTRRAQRWDGSCLYHAETHDLLPDDVRDLRAGAGQRPFDICVGGRQRRDGDSEWLRGVADAGATWWAEYVPPQDRSVMIEAVRRGPLRID